MKGGEVWVFIEQSNGRSHPISWELLGEGRRLADSLGGGLTALIMGAGVIHLTEETFEYGADRVILIDDPALERYRNHPYAKGITDVCRKYQPQILLIGATTLGRDLAGTVATDLETGLTADCTSLEVDQENGLLRQTRPAFGGNIMATILCKDHRPQMATVRPRVFRMPRRQPGRRGEIVRWPLDLKEDEIPTKILEVFDEAGAPVYLDKAEIIVSGGKGLGGPGGFEELGRLARVLGGTLAASRPAVEAGWIGAAHQVGQTGQTVRPKIYIAVGISGAIQHLVGMQNSDVIVAINHNPEAPILKVATYGLIGDWRRVVPLLIREFETRLRRPRTSEADPVATEDVSSPKLRIDRSPPAEAPVWPAGYTRPVTPAGGKH